MLLLLLASLVASILDSVVNVFHVVVMVASFCFSRLNCTSVLPGVFQSVSFALCVSSPDLRQDRGSDRSNDGSSIPVVLVQESAEDAWAFDLCVFWSGIAVGFEKHGDLGVERLKLIVGGDESLDGVEHGPGFFVHRTIGILMGT
jgi:hypothetical protein